MSYNAKAQKNYDKKIIRIVIKINNETEPELIKIINSFDNKTQEIKQAIIKYGSDRIPMKLIEKIEVR